MRHQRNKSGSIRRGSAVALSGVSRLDMDGTAGAVSGVNALDMGAVAAVSGMNVLDVDGAAETVSSVNAPDMEAAALSCEQCEHAGHGWRPEWRAV